MDISMPDLKKIKEFETIQNNLTVHAIEYANTSEGILFHDPWNTQIRLILRAGI